MEKLSFVIPCYRSATTLADVVNEIIVTVNERPEYDYEIILVNDCSPDDTQSVIEQLCMNNPKIKGIHLAKNFGQHAALMAGYAHVTGDIAVNLDDDGQTPANEVFLLIDRLNMGYDVVFAKYESKEHNGFRNWGSSVNRIMAEYLIGKPKNTYISSFFVTRRFIIDEMLRYKNAFPYIAGLIFRATRNISDVPVHHRAREQGQSGYTTKKLLSLWMNGFTAFSVKPLRIATVAGFICAACGFLYSLYLIIQKLINPNVQMGYSSIMATLLFIGGATMLILGLIGEYIGRIYISINNSPQYVIRKTVNTHSNEN